LKGLIFLLVLLFIGGGFAAVGEALGVLGQVIMGFFPIFYEVGKMAVEDYLTSPYFIVGIIMFIGSCFGIYFGVKGGKILHLIISIICASISLISIGGNLI